jgi:hypothetical protein
MNSFWKFDECSGDTIGDSSGHNYDGTRYGASWDSNGYSGCCLEFDGIDDYVDFTDHAKGINFNKTDDGIFSFYFKSTMVHLMMELGIMLNTIIMVLHQIQQ